ncbi:MAG: 23S rRNA (guanosine(2251)-2'-O)-methyltransferase RlmB, partial [Betaproteobacteria bacterium]|nr:23S rRNA (guanosine(2251)-2'-O)-methyltransferase RlmB [Betaproteobacteria bacterium]
KRQAESIEVIYVDENRRDPRMRELVDLAKRQGIKLHPVDAQRVERLAPGRRHQGVVAICSLALPSLSVEDLFHEAESLPRLLLLDGVTDPRNLGACMRAADGAGVRAVIAPKDNACPLTDAAIQTASGAAESVSYILVTNLVRTMQMLQERGLWLLGFCEDAPTGLWEASWPVASGFVMGAEGRGLRRLVRETCDQLVHLPMMGQVASLNVAVASGIVLYEAVRRQSCIAPGHKGSVAPI